uniref:Integrase catalytic domain-containing protein n=1 Tax=Panagrolaimus sp. JU765 TaxID=591449 RepID=A0AC34PVE5_9BILA
MKNSGKSAIAVKYLTKRFLGEYCSDLEDTYCRQETIGQMPIMIWLMDTVDGAERDPMRYLAWADIFVVIYDITNIFVVIYDITSRLSFQIAEQLLQQISGHEHSLCERDHRTLLVGNKIDLDRYRQVSESDGEKLARKYNVMFAEISATFPHPRIQTMLHKPISLLIKERADRRSPSPRLYSSDSEVQARQRKSGFSFRSVARSGTLRHRRSPSPRLYSSDSEVQARQRKSGFSFRSVARSGTLRRSKSPKLDKMQKQKSGSKTGLFKLFHT